MEAARPQPKPFVIPVFIPHAGCPHRCIFCNQHSTTGQSESFPNVSAIRRIIDDFLRYRRERERWTEISFYGGNFLGLPPERIQLLLSTAAAYVRQGKADGIRFSTRPDTIDSSRLALIGDFPVSTIELGVQSMNDQVLQQCRRGHTAQDTRKAMALLKGRPYRVGAQMMVGLPGDTAAADLATGRQITTLSPDFVRIYPTLVLRGSTMARWYEQGRYTPLALDAAVVLVAELYCIFSRNDIPVVRIGLQATSDLSPEADLVAGPFHPAFGELVQSAIWQDALSRHMAQEGLGNAVVILDVPPRLLSQIKGHRDENIISLIDRHRLVSLEVRTSVHVPHATILVNGKPCTRW